MSHVIPCPMFGRLKEGEPSALAARNGKKPWLSEAQILVRSYQGRVSQRICIVIYIIRYMYIIMKITIIIVITIIIIVIVITIIIIYIYIYIYIHIYIYTYIYIYVFIYLFIFSTQKKRCRQVEETWKSLELLHHWIIERLCWRHFPGIFLWVALLLHVGQGLACQAELLEGGIGCKVNPTNNHIDHVIDHSHESLHYILSVLAFWYVF